MATTVTGKLRNKINVLLLHTWATFKPLSGATQDGDALTLPVVARTKTNGAGVFSVVLAPGDYELWANGENVCQVAVPDSVDTQDLLDVISSELSTAPGMPTSGNATKIQGRDIDPAAPADGQALRWDAGAEEWLPSSGGGRQSIWLPAGSFTTRTTSGAAVAAAETTTNKVNVVYLDFDAAAQEYVQALIRMPKSWDLGALKCEFYWTVASGTGDVVWSAAAVPISNDDALDAARLAAATVTDTVITAEDLHRSAESGDVVCTGAAVGDVVALEVSRVATDGADTLAVDARLIGVLVTYNTNAESDT